MSDRDAAPPPPSPSRTPTSIARTAAIGAVSGVVGTFVMSGLMLPARWAGILGTQPPRRIADRGVSVLGLDRRADEHDRRAGTVLTHLAIGAGSGAVLGVVRKLARDRIPAVPTGIGFGTGLWGIAYIAILPALDLFPPPQRDRPGRPPVMLAANILYGAVTAALIDDLERRCEPHAFGRV